jgi:hypothetical protein
MALTDNTVHEFQRPDNAKRRQMNVAASTTIYKGAFVVIDGSGNVINAPVTGANVFVGIAENYYANTVASPTTDEPLTVRFEDLLKHAVTGGTAANITAKVYYTDNDALSTTIVPSTGVVGSQVGRLHAIHKDGTPIVDLSKNEY